MRLLVVGGSQGATILGKVVPGLATGPQSASTSMMARVSRYLRSIGW